MVWTWESKIKNTQHEKDSQKTRVVWHIYECETREVNFQDDIMGDMIWVNGHFKKSSERDKMNVNCSITRKIKKKNDTFHTCFIPIDVSCLSGWDGKPLVKWVS